MYVCAHMCDYLIFTIKVLIIKSLNRDEMLPIP